jgi:hypothetical protein
MKVNKNLILFSLSVLFCLQSYTQVDFRNISFDEALKESATSGKLIFIQFESETCIQCNEVADKAFSDIKLGEKMNQSFICLKISSNHLDRQKVAALFNKSNMSFGSLFVAADGSLVHTYAKSSTMAKNYREEAEKALSKSGEGLRIKNLEELYKNGNSNPGFLEMYITARKSLQLDTDKLLDEYVTLIPADSLQSQRIFLFIVQMTPLFESEAYKKLEDFYFALNKRKYNYQYPFHASVKASIANKSMRKAIAEKNETYAIRVAGFARTMYPLDNEKAKKTYDSFLIDYYKGVNNYDKYLQLASSYYDTYFMAIPVDSVKKADTVHMNRLAQGQTGTKVKQGDSLLIRKQIVYASESGKISNELTGAARKFLEITDKAAYLSKALQWSEKAIAFNDTFTAMNVYALLLYKTNNKPEAISWQEKAITLKKKQGFDTKSLEKELSEMK